MDQNDERNKGVVNGKSMEDSEMTPTRRRRSAKKGSVCDLSVRILAFTLALAAAVIAGLDKQTKLVPVKLLDSLPPLDVPVTAKWHYLSAFVYFVVTNAMASAYAGVSMVVCLARRGTRMVVLLDAVTVALLFSGNGAAVAISLVGLRGNSHVRWNKVCDVFGKFCNQMEIALAFSLLAAFAFLFLLLLPLLRLHSTTTTKITS